MPSKNAQSAQILVMKDQGAVVGPLDIARLVRVVLRSSRRTGRPFFSLRSLQLIVVAVSLDHSYRRVFSARNDSAKVIGLFTSELMTAAQQLYESMGFCRESEIPSRFGLRYWRYKLQLEEPITPEATWLADRKD